MARLSIVICTYERPLLLAAALRSILSQDGLDAAGLEIVVVDNSDSGSARAVVEGWAANASIPIAYVPAHPANISVARNAGCRAARGEAVAFLDDDQELAPGWLAAVRDGLARLPHDVFFGPIAPRYEDPGAVTPPAQALFTRAGDLPTGHDLVAFDRPSGQPFVLSTANSVFRRATALPGADPFDPHFGLCGGEDLHLLCRLQRAGRRFGWLPKAGASDFVPRHRCGAPYLVRRHFAGGQAYAAALIRTSPKPARDGAALTLKAALQVLLLPVLALGCLRRPAPGRSLAIRAAGIVGKLFWRRLYPLYRAEDRARQVARAGARP
ncbi:glycosyltransferase family 2 protein [Methylobacterium sp. NEAU K]|uniref:glycosyltransferase family 2 protein n=1 Tax=Methylobacterium sp. NEAU K TaxID=3064946 RepID=UPI0027350583|nr:glycosyltransferase family 2 protein [Methylobacterium sp. NEAU K]MDP4006125.1 glycosyltransferase [Methylobacterium sp. NEAU K]